MGTNFNPQPKIIKPEAALLAELEASDGDGIEFSEIESELDTDSFLDQLERQNQSKRLARVTRVTPIGSK